jgi:hypothetical protein
MSGTDPIAYEAVVVGGGPAGVYLASSNRSGSDQGVTFGGAGWITGSDGTVLAMTDEDHPFATVDVDSAVAEHAETTYPRDALARAEERRGRQGEAGDADRVRPARPTR